MRLEPGRASLPCDWSLAEPASHAIDHVLAVLVWALSGQGLEENLKKLSAAMQGGNGAGGMASLLSEMMGGDGEGGGAGGADDLKARVQQQLAAMMQERGGGGGDEAPAFGDLDEEF